MERKERDRWRRRKTRIIPRSWERVSLYVVDSTMCLVEDERFSEAVEGKRAVQRKRDEGVVDVRRVDNTEGQRE